MEREFQNALPRPSVMIIFRPNFFYVFLVTVHTKVTSWNFQIDARGLLLTLDDSMSFGGISAHRFFFPENKIDFQNAVSSFGMIFFQSNFYRCSP